MTATILPPGDGIIPALGQDGAVPVTRMDPSAAVSQRFSSTFERAMAAAATGVAPAGQVQAVKVAQLPTPVADGGAGPVTDAAAEVRARRALQLDAPVAADSKQNSGDVILGGLQKLRGVFDAQQARINSIMQQPAANMTSLMQMQMEVVHFSLLVDVTSKLTGKSTQAFDTLMKGQ